MKGQDIVKFLIIGAVLFIGYELIKNIFSKGSRSSLTIPQNSLTGQLISSSPEAGGVNLSIPQGSQTGNLVNLNGGSVLGENFGFSPSSGGGGAVSPEPSFSSGGYSYSTMPGAWSSGGYVLNNSMLSGSSSIG